GRQRRGSWASSAEGGRKGGAEAGGAVAERGGGEADAAAWDGPGAGVHPLRETGKEEVGAVHHAAAEHDALGAVGVDDVDDGEGEVVEVGVEGGAVDRAAVADGIEKRRERVAAFELGVGVAYAGGERRRRAEQLRAAALPARALGPVAVDGDVPAEDAAERIGADIGPPVGDERAAEPGAERQARHHARPPPRPEAPL